MTYEQALLLKTHILAIVEDPERWLEREADNVHNDEDRFFLMDFAQEEMKKRRDENGKAFREWCVAHSLDETSHVVRLIYNVVLASMVELQNAVGDLEGSSNDHENELMKIDGRLNELSRQTSGKQQIVELTNV